MKLGLLWAFIGGGCVGWAMSLTHIEDMWVVAIRVILMILGVYFISASLLKQ